LIKKTYCPEFYVRRAVRRVNTNINEFVADNAYINDVGFDNVSMGHREGFG
jgi:hypothetical protein